MIMLLLTRQDLHTREFFASKRINEDRLIKWPPSSPDLNYIENLWCLVKTEIYQGCKKCSSKYSLLEAIETCYKSLNSSVILRLTVFMDDRLVTVFERKGVYINK